MKAIGYKNNGALTIKIQYGAQMQIKDKARLFFSFLSNENFLNTTVLAMKYSTKADKTVKIEQTGMYVK